ncbi:MAG: acetyl-CoA carboxylase biotin carboxyl carrier protein subunit [Paludibacter sp.]|jgi:biotin carboxyl carrier protein|nr:acetyl-CoA carboxylase biotin carboxyl carrier protein subunit [Paludibacter sp.]
MKKYLIKVNQNQYEVEVVEVKQGAIASVETRKTSETPKPKTSISETKIKENNAPQNSKKVIAPMPGNVMKVLVAPGEQVKKEQKLLVFESMKMENELTSPFEGTVMQINTSEGSVMSAGQLLLVIA